MPAAHDGSALCCSVIAGIFIRFRDGGNFYANSFCVRDIWLPAQQLRTNRPAHLSKKLDSYNGKEGFIDNKGGKNFSLNYLERLCALGG